MPGVAVVAAVVAGALVAGCGGVGDSDTPPASGAPAASATTAGTTEANRTRKCQAFAGTVRSEEKELTYTGQEIGKSNDGAMGKLINETGATVWVLPAGLVKTWAKRECTLEAGASTFFSRNGSYAFAFRPEAQEPDDAACDFATCIRLRDPTVGYAEFWGSVDRDVYEPQYKVEQKENQENSFIWGASKVTVKREKDNYYDSQFPKDYFTDNMDDWAHFTVRVESLIKF